MHHTLIELTLFSTIQHIGRSKHVPQEKSTGKDGVPKPLWGPIFKAHLKRMEGVGELSLCKVCCSGNLTTAVSNDSTLAGDVRSHLLVSTEEGDVIFADLCGKKPAEPSHGKDEKDQHASVFEKDKSVETEHRSKTLFFV